MALHQKSGRNTRDSSFVQNKTPGVVVACNLCARPAEVFRPPTLVSSCRTTESDIHPISALLILPFPLLPITHRSLRLNSRDRIVSQATSVHNRPERMASVMSEGTDTATGMSEQQRTVATNLGTLTLPTSREIQIVS